MLWYLVLTMYVSGTGASMVVMPSRYVTIQACEVAGKHWDKSGGNHSHECVAVPAEGEENG
jgi:hypothetical protein